MDLKYPNIKIQSFQFDNLQLKTKYGEAIRFLMDILFEKEEIKKKNFTIIRNEYPDRYEIIKNFALEKFKCSNAQINKSITDKCHI